MEFLVLNSYLKFKKENKNTFWDILKTKKPSHNIAFFIGIIAALTALTFLLLLLFYTQTKFLLWYLLFFLLEICSYMFLLISGNRASIEHSDTTLSQQDMYYKNVLKWLKSIEYSKKNQIKQLCKRCELKIIENKSEQEKSNKFIDTLFTILIAPTLLAIISWVLEFNAELNEHFAVVGGLLGITCILYFGIKCILNEIQTYLNHTYTDMQRMVNDMHGVLDRCFKITDKDLF